MISFAILTAVGLQTFFMAIDEFYFHRKRGLGPWERLGHPLDTTSVLAYLCALSFFEPQSHLGVVTIIGIASSLLITKDEWVHHIHCEATEHWVHSILFILHPIILGLFGMGWWNGLFLRGSTWEWILDIQIGITFLFLLYQYFYWNVFRKEVLIR